VIKSRIIGGWGIWHIRRRGQMHIGFWRKKLGTKCRIILKWFIQKYGWWVWTALI